MWEVIDGLVGGDVPPAERISRAVETFGLPRHLVEAALAYYAEFTDEIDELVDANRQAAEKAEVQWRRQQTPPRPVRLLLDVHTPTWPPNDCERPATT